MEVAFESKKRTDAPEPVSCLSRIVCTHQGDDRKAGLVDQVPGDLGAQESRRSGEQDVAMRSARVHAASRPGTVSPSVDFQP